jgi:superfamily II DNA or RNA helicase
MSAPLPCSTMLRPGQKPSDDEDQARELTRARDELGRLRAENARLRGLLGLDNQRAAAASGWEPRLFDEAASLPTVDAHSPPDLKVELFRAVFVGRGDVFALRWENARTGKSGWSPAVKGGWTRARAPDREYLPLTEDVISKHLSGELTVGLYPLLRGDTCRLLACDFDGATWVLDALAYLEACAAAGVPAALERSRSGNGAHVWALFSAEVSAVSARRLGACLLREAMSMRSELDLASYDRLFPAQEFMPKGSLGNLIALPLQGVTRRQGNTVFLDPSTLEPFGDQWRFLSGLGRLSAPAVESLVESLRPVEAGPDATRLRAPRDRPAVPVPARIPARRAAMLVVERIGLPPPLVASLKHLASLHNPDFYEKQRLRFSTWRTPRFIRCYEETIDELRLPRGLLDQAERLIRDAGSSLVIAEGCPPPAAAAFDFAGVLTDQQQRALGALAGHELGVLVAPPGAGKTVIACARIAEVGVRTLVVVNRRPLMDQWRARLEALLGLTSAEIGKLNSGAKRRVGLVDVVMAQSLARRDDIEELTAGYGLVVVDECHHIPAATFEAFVRRIPVRGWLGLTATPYRRDGLEDLITMHCGPIRHQIPAEAGPSAGLQLELIVHHTGHEPPTVDDQPIQDIFRCLVEDDYRTAVICDDVERALDRGRRCLVLTQRTDHIERLCKELESRGHGPLVLRGGMGQRARRAVLDELGQARDKGLVLIATGSYLGEGFDSPQLDTLFLAFPLAFKGGIVQYVGRVLRAAEGKHDVEVHDYVDTQIPVLARMHTKRRQAYASLGFDTSRSAVREDQDP